jgi:hypothetical protein
MKTYKIKRINNYLDKYGRNKYEHNAKNKWIEIGCADNKKEIEQKLLEFIRKQYRKEYGLFIDDCRYLRIKIENRCEESLIIDTLSNIHNILEIDDLFETFRKINQK